MSLAGRTFSNLMKPRVLLLVTLSFLAPSFSFGLGTRIVDQDAAATARGEAFVATADNPSAIYYNPAGITQLDGFEARAGLYGIGLHVHDSPETGEGFESK